MTLCVISFLVINLSFNSPYLCNQVIRVMFVVEENTEVSIKLGKVNKTNFSFSDCHNHIIIMGVITWV